MPTTHLILFAVDLAAALVLVFGVYYRRHRRRDLVVAFLGINVGVLAVSTVLGTAEIAMGLGLGLFGVLSIIRLRSDEISQREVAYYFSALAMGLIAGLSSASVLLPSVLIAVIVAVMWIADHPALLGRSRHQIVRLDRAITNENELRTELESRLGGTVTSLAVQHLDLVNDSTLVDVRFRIDAPSASNRPPQSNVNDGRAAPAEIAQLNAVERSDAGLRVRRAPQATASRMGSA